VRLLEAALAASEMGTFVWHVADDRGVMDAQTMRLLGITGPAMITLAGAISKFIHPDDQARVAAAVQAALDPNGLRTVSEDLRVVLPDGSERWLSIAARMLFTGDRPKALVGTAKDITRRKLTEAALRDREEQLSELARRKDEWIALLAHELRNPLAPLRTGLDTLRLVPERPDLIAETTEMMVRQVRHVAQLIDDLLEMSRVARGKVTLRRQVVPLADIVRVARDAHHAAIAAQQLVLDVRLDDALVLEVDADRIVQVVSNVLHNATKFTPPGGRIEIVGREDGDQVVVIVRDTGTGIAADLLPRLFEPFMQGARASDLGGLGIGLALARQLVELHGGEIRAHSDGPGRGTEIAIRLPRARLASGSGAYHASADRRDRAHDAVDVDRLDEVVVEPGLAGPDRVAGLAVAGDGDHEPRGPR
jgi:two-component system CheB/CheR fusion protein